MLAMLLSLGSSIDTNAYVGWSTALPDNVQYFKYITQWMASAVNQVS